MFFKDKDTSGFPGALPMPTASRESRSSCCPTSARKTRAFSGQQGTLVCSCCFWTYFFPPCSFLLCSSPYLCSQNTSFTDANTEPQELLCLDPGSTARWPQAGTVGRAPRRHSKERGSSRLLTSFSRHITRDLSASELNASRRQRAPPGAKLKPLCTEAHTAGASGSHLPTTAL